MGGGSSTANNFSNFVNNIVSTATTNVMQNYSTTMAVTQSMNLGCTDSAHAECVALLQSVALSGNVDMYNAVKGSCCSYMNLHQIANISLTAKQVQDNNIGQQIASSIQAQLQNEITAQTEAPIGGYSQNDINNINDISNSFNSSLINNIVTNVINTYSYDQQLVIGNTTLANNINQTLAVTIISDQIMSQALSQSSVAQSALTALNQTSSTMTGGIEDVIKSIGSNIANVLDTALESYVAIILGLFLVLAFLAWKFPKLFCIIPIASLVLDCNSSSNTNEDDEDENDEETENSYLLQKRKYKMDSRKNKFNFIKNIFDLLQNKDFV